MNESSVRAAMIVAGGAGTRLAPLTATTPKPLLPFCGAPLLEGMLLRLHAVGVERVALVVGANTVPFDQFAAEAGPRIGLAVHVVDEPEPLDTAGGVRQAAEHLDEAFFVLNGDIVTDLDLAAMARHHRRAEAVATLALTRVDDTSTFGVCVLDGDRIVGFVEKPAPGTLDGHNTVNAGTYLLEPSVFDGQPHGRLSFERQVFPDAVARAGVVVGHVTDACWADLGTPQRYLEGHWLALNGDVRWPTLERYHGDADAMPTDGPLSHRRWVASSAQISDSAELVPPLFIGEGAVIGDHTTIGPYAVIGSGSHVAAAVRVDHSVVHDHARIGTAISGAIIADHVRLEPGVHVGDDVVIASGVHVTQGHVASGARLKDTHPPTAVVEQQQQGAPSS